MICMLNARGTRQQFWLYFSGKLLLPLQIELGSYEYRFQDRLTTIQYVRYGKLKRNCVHVGMLIYHIQIPTVYKCLYCSHTLIWLVKFLIPLLSPFLCVYMSGGGGGWYSCKDMCHRSGGEGGGWLSLVLQVSLFSLKPESHFCSSIGFPLLYCREEIWIEGNIRHLT